MLPELAPSFAYAVDMFVRLGPLFSLLLSICLALPAQVQSGFPIPLGAQAGPSFNAQTATQAYLDTLGSQRKARSDAYFEGGYWLILWDFLYGAAVLLLILTTGLSTKCRGWAERLTQRKPLVAWLYWLQFALLSFVFGLPLTIYESFFRERQYDLMNQTFSAWFVDQLKGLGLLMVFGGLVAMVLLATVRRLPRTWHIWGAIVAFVFGTLSVLIFPVFIAPMFNKYTILTDARFRDPILRLARQNGIPATNVYQVNASRQSNRISANVSGFLGTERITLNDNLMNRCSQSCVQAVMGHEMGHYVLNHLYKMRTFMLIITVVMFAGLRRAMNWGLARGSAKWGVGELADPAAIPLALLVFSLFSFVLTPINNTLIRTQEYEADIFGLNTARQPDGFAEAALLLSEYRKLSPSPVEEFIFFDHPSGRTRIFCAMRWKGENE
jgi:STE24 endopeptidase